MSLASHILNLPRGLLQEIFRELLLTKYTKRAAPYQHPIRHALQPGLLRVCHRFQSEGKQLLYHENVFVHVGTNNLDLFRELKYAGLSWFKIGKSVNEFPYYSLRALIFFHPQEDAPLQPCRYYVMLPAEDLERFCLLFWLLRIRQQLEISLKLTVLTPLGGPEHSIAKQESLVLPFYEFWFISRAAIDGDIDFGVSERLREALRGTLPASLPERKEFFLAHTQKADHLGKTRNYFQCAITYNKAFLAFKGLQMDPSFRRQSLRLTLSLMSDITLTFLRLGAWRYADESASFVVTLTQKLLWNHLASNVAARSPPREHLLTMVITYFRRGVARRMVGNEDGSKQDLETAMSYALLCYDTETTNYLRREQIYWMNHGPVDRPLRIQRARFGFL